MGGGDLNIGSNDDDGGGDDDDDNINRGFNYNYTVKNNSNKLKRIFGYIYSRTLR